MKIFSEEEIIQADSSRNQPPRKKYRLFQPSETSPKSESPMTRSQILEAPDAVRKELPAGELVSHNERNDESETALPLGSADSDWIFSAP